MIQKAFADAGGRPQARVTFVLPNCTWADAVHLVGDFNGWNRASYPFQRGREGHWRLTLELELGKAYQFRYLRDGEQWMNENQADAQVLFRNGDVYLRKRCPEHGWHEALASSDADWHLNSQACLGEGKRLARRTVELIQDGAVGCALLIARKG